MTTKLSVGVICYAVLLATPAFADDVANREAVRVEIEYLRETGRLSIGGIDIATGHALAEFYERRDFSPTWTDREQAKELLELVRASHDDGLDPDDYHAEQIEKVYREMSRGSVLTPRQQAAVDLAFSDRLVRMPQSNRAAFARGSRAPRINRMAHATYSATSINT